MQRKRSFERIRITSCHSNFEIPQIPMFIEERRRRKFSLILGSKLDGSSLGSGPEGL